MNKINIIEPSVYNRISAGEVIERPVSVVKECIENSLDSGAFEILIYVTNNAKNIRIVDNGSGMSKDDAKLAFLPHCTSKLKTAEDLCGIRTLGFRGEALASIASISMITLNTFDCETEEATRLEIKGGELLEVGESSISYGTDISVENLFFNTPVREKFLKSARSEESEITNLVTRMILSNPDVAFSYYLNNEEKFIFNGDGIEKAIYMIYGKSALDGSIRVTGDKYDIIINGYIGTPEFTKGNRTYQTLILNGRYVVNETISMAIFKAYQPFLMKRCYPFYVLNVEISLEKVDVNVHPTKHDVRFSDSKEVFKSVYGTISAALSGEAENIVDKSIFRRPDDTPIVEEKFSINEQMKINPKFYGVKNDLNPMDNKREENFFDNPYDKIQKQSSEQKPSNETNESTTTKKNSGIFINTDIPMDVTSERYKRLFNLNDNEVVTPLETPFQPYHDTPFYDASIMPKIINAYSAKPQKPLKPVVNDDGTYILEATKRYKKEDTHNGFFLFDSESTVDEYPDYAKVRVIGVFNKTYIIAEYEDTLYFVDQHAAHERILYDEYTLAYYNEKILVQDLIVPYMFEINMEEEEFLKKHISNLYILGFRIDHFGTNTFRINSVPVALCNINFDKFLKDLFSDLDRIIDISSIELVRDKIMQKACKHAVKAGDQLSEYEIRCVFKMLEKTKNLTCPHGRPVFVSYKKTEVEKWFKRIV